MTNQKDGIIMDYFERLIEEIDSFSFSGWDFSYIAETGRMQETPMKWNYFSRIRPYLYTAERLPETGHLHQGFPVGISAV